jgi:hypothetical protein
MEELKQIKTMSLRDYIDKEITKLHQETIEELSRPMNKTSRLVALQEIAYRLEYGFITEIGTKSLKEHLAKP